MKNKISIAKMDKENMENQMVICANRDPTQNDMNFPFTLLISKEYIPHRVFKGGSGNWIFIGKFYPENNERKTKILS